MSWPRRPGVLHVSFGEAISGVRFGPGSIAGMRKDGYKRNAELLFILSRFFFSDSCWSQTTSRRKRSVTGRPILFRTFQKPPFEGCRPTLAPGP